MLDFASSAISGSSPSPPRQSFSEPAGKSVFNALGPKHRKTDPAFYVCAAFAETKPDKIRQTAKYASGQSLFSPRNGAPYKRAVFCVVFYVS